MMFASLLCLLCWTNVLEQKHTEFSGLIWCSLGETIFELTVFANWLLR